MEHRARTARRAEPAEPQPKRRLKGEARIDAILHAAAQLFAEDGLGGTTRQIAERLGVTDAVEKVVVY
ncbi:MAG: TetR family transcriptional regulator [Geminicoccaceae bacterium]